MSENDFEFLVRMLYCNLVTTVMQESYEEKGNFESFIDTRCCEGEYESSGVMSCYEYEAL